MLQDQALVGLQSSDKFLILSLLRLSLRVFQAAVRHYSFTHQHIKRQIYQQQYHTLLPVVNFLCETTQAFLVDVNQDTEEILFQCADIFIIRNPGSELTVKCVSPECVTLLLDYEEVNHLLDDLYVDQLEEIEIGVKSL